MKSLRLVPLAAVWLAGCTLNVNNPVVNTAVGPGAQVGAPGVVASASPTTTATSPTASALPLGDDAPADPPGVGVRDQQSLKTGIAVVASRDARVGQVFMPARTGELAAVGVRLAYRGEQAPDAILAIFAAGATGGPTGALLGQAPLPAAEVTTDRDARWAVARFETPVALSAGSRYAWTLSVPGAFTLVVGAGDNRSYEAGEGYTASGSGTTWNRTGFDFAFRTYLSLN